MADLFDRLAAGPNNLQQRDFDDWNEMVGAAPPDRFTQAANQAMRDVDPREYYEHSQPGIGGTDPFGALERTQREGVLGSLLGSLFKRGMNRDEVMRDSGLNSLDPDRMSPDEMARLAQWMQRNHPEAFGATAVQYRDRPDLLSSLLGNKALMMAAAALGAKFLSDRMGRR